MANEVIAHVSIAHTDTGEPYLNSYSAFPNDSSVNDAKKSAVFIPGHRFLYAPRPISTDRDRAVRLLQMLTQTTPEVQEALNNLVQQCIELGIQIGQGGHQTDHGL